MNSLSRKVVVASLCALGLLAVCYVMVARELVAWGEASAYVMRDYQRALLDGEFHEALTRATGETASYMLTGKDDYRAEAAEALARADAAAVMLRLIVDAAPAAEGEPDHVQFLERQERLLQSTKERIRQANASSGVTGMAAADDVLRQVYSHEADADAAWRDIVAHHRDERLENEQRLSDHSRRAHWLTLTGVAAFALAIGLLIVYVRLSIVDPLRELARLTTSVARGDLTRSADVTHSDEIGQLQRSFNRMIVDLGTQRRQLSTMVETLSRSRDEAHAANVAKSEFLANVSHEIRTPMNGVIVSLDLMHETAPNQEQRELIDVARSAARSLLGMLNDLLDFSRIETGKLALESAVFEPRRLVSQMVELHGRRAAAKGLVMNCQVADDVPTQLCGDPARLGQVLLNLLDNAIKFTERGSIDVTLELDAPAPGSPPATVGLRFTVADSGIGIAPQAAEQIFQPFFQVDGSSTRKHSGIGLGLGIARHLARAMGGDLGFTSVVGKGTSFWFTVHLMPAALCGEAPAQQPAVPLQLPPGRTVLLAEDSRSTREVMTRMLERRGLRVIGAENGRVALALAEQERFDLILMDCQMPEMDGFEAVRAIRALGGAPATVPVVALTAYGLSGQKQRYLDAGFDDLVAKPYTVEEIEEMLLRWLAAERSNEAGAA